MNGSRPFLFYRDASQSGFGATVEQQQADGRLYPTSAIIDYA